MKGLEFLNDYKKMAPILMGVLLVGAVYGRVNAAHKDTLTYEDHLNAAREYREEKIYATSKEEYEKALKMKESLDLRCEIAEMLMEEGNPTKITNWGENITEKYPTEAEGYKYLIENYQSEENYGKCFEVYDVVKKRNINCEDIEKLISSIRYTYKMDWSQYEEVSDFVAGYAICKMKDAYGLISEGGSRILDFAYQKMSACDGNYVCVTDVNNETYYIDLNGERRFNLPDGADTEKLEKLYQGIMPVHINGKMFYYSADDGLQILGPYDDGGPFTYGFAAVKENNKWHLITPDGTRATDDYEGFLMNDAGGVVSGGHVFALTNKGYRLLDGNMQQVGSSLYEDARGYSEDSLTAVKKDGKWGFIDGNGNFVIKPKYENAYSFSNGIAPVCSNGLWGYIDENDIWVVEPQFTDARALNETGCGFVMRADSTQWSLIQFYEYNY